MHLRPSECVCVEEPAVVERTTFTAEATVEHEKGVGDGGETVPRATLHDVSFIIVLNSCPVHLLHIKDVHVIHSLGAISTSKDKDSASEASCGMSSTCDGHIASRQRPLPLVALRIVANKLVVPPTRIVLCSKRKRLVTLSLKKENLNLPRVKSDRG